MSVENQFSNKNSNVENIEIFKNEIKKLSYEESIDALELILESVQDENISLDGRKVILVPLFFVLPICFRGFIDFPSLN